jgi:hypothetical protein
MFIEEIDRGQAWVSGIPDIDDPQFVQLRLNDDEIVSVIVHIKILLRCILIFNYKLIQRGIRKIIFPFMDKFILQMKCCV